MAIPTIAATCAAATPISILYSDEGEFFVISRESKAPDLVLVGSTIIIRAPVRYSIAGIGDTLAKWFETNCSIKKAVPIVRNQTAIAIASQFISHIQMVKKAVTSVENQRLTREFEDIVDAVILVSGSVSGYCGDDCRTAAAHLLGFDHLS